MWLRLNASLKILGALAHGRPTCPLPPKNELFCPEDNAFKMPFFSGRFSLNLDNRPAKDRNCDFYRNGMLIAGTHVKSISHRSTEKLWWEMWVKCICHICHICMKVFHIIHIHLTYISHHSFSVDLWLIDLTWVPAINIPFLSLIHIWRCRRRG